MEDNLRQEIAIVTVIGAENYSGNLLGLKKYLPLKVREGPEACNCTGWKHEWRNWSGGIYPKGNLRL